ncbi:MAG: integral rane alanine and leucine rich protein [Frankiales bacterium]|nr:integral rane alanine and leucine rich protein [Frankiales bacterium]
MAGPPPDGLREQTRQQLLQSVGGWSGTVITAIPPIVFVIANSLGGLREAILTAVGSGLLIAVYRLIRRQSLQQVLMGLVSVGLAAAIAARTGQARGFFLLGIAGSILYAAVFAVSLLVRRPLVGVLWEFLDPTPLAAGATWRRVPSLYRAYVYSTVAAFAMFAARGAVQATLFQHNRTGLLAVARLAMGYPLYALVVAYTFWVIRRARQPLLAAAEAAEASEATEQPAPAEPAAGPALEAEPPVRSELGADRGPDRRLSLRKGDEK